MNVNSDGKPSWEPIGDPAATSGYAVPARIQGDRENFAKLSKVAAEILDDPLQVMMLADKVYELMREDLRNQKERQRNYG